MLQWSPRISLLVESRLILTSNSGASPCCRLHSSGYCRVGLSSNLGDVNSSSFPRGLGTSSPRVGRHSNVQRGKSWTNSLRSGRAAVRVALWKMERLAHCHESCALKERNSFCTACLVIGARTRGTALFVFAVFCR